MNKRLLKIWYDMIRRCSIPKCPSFYRYGGRGIKVCDEWLSKDEFIKWAINNGYNDSLTLDRIDVNGCYSPLNCKWSTMKEQGSNKRNNVLLTYNGNTKTMSEWSEMLGISVQLIKYRLSAGWDISEIFDICDRRKIKRRLVKC